MLDLALNNPFQSFDGKEILQWIFEHQIITNCPLQVNEIERQIAELYASTHTKFVEKIVVFKGNAIIRVYKRQ